MLSASRAMLVLKNMDADELVGTLGVSSEDIMIAFPEKVERFIDNEEADDDDTLGDTSECV